MLTVFCEAKFRRDAREAEGARLEIVCSDKIGTEGSNPSLSARKFAKQILPITCNISRLIDRKGGWGVKAFPKKGLILIAVAGILISFGLEQASAQQYFFFEGKVESLYREQLTVKSGKGETMYFAIGRRTIYIPSRKPGIGERVKVTYFLRRGHNVASQVEILPSPSSPSPAPPKK